jgi:hypothetical protein
LYDEVRNNSLEDVGIADCLQGKSDHRPAYARWLLGEHKPKRRKRKRVQVGWKPVLNEKGQPADYHAALDGTLADAQGGLAESVVEAATVHAAETSRPQRTHCEEVKALFEQRREEHDEVQRKVLSKQLWKALRRQRRQRADAELVLLAENGSGLRKLRRNQQQQAGAERITGVKDEQGKLNSDPDSICEVFALFYEDLYKEELIQEDSGRGFHDGPDLQTHPLTTDEVDKALRMLKNGRTGADDGLVAEMLKTDHRGLIDALAAFLDDIFQNKLEAPDEWRQVKLKVIFKKGDPELP